jgi:hypothetical protein
MTIRAVAIAVLLLAASAASPASAQDLRGFAGGGVAGTVNSEHFPIFGGGAVADVAQPWISVGGQGEVLISWPYFAGRGAVFGQANLVVRKSLRPFVLVGTGFGEESGPFMFGGGVELRAPNSRYGFRVSVEDNVRTSHQISFRGALLF